MVQIASYGDTPFNWNRDTRDRYSCAPTNVSYRVLGQPGQQGVTCPIEARIPEINVSPGGAPSLCCTSRQGPASHAESLWFLRTLKAIGQGAAAGGFRYRVPRNLRRILRWINLSTNVSDIGGVQPNAIIVVHSNRERYLDLLKFAVMSASSTPVHVRLPNAAAGYECKFHHRYLDMKEGTSLYDDVIRVVNEVGRPIGECTLEVVTPYSQQLVRLDPIHAVNVEINNDQQRSRCVDLGAITHHFATGNGRRWVGQRTVRSHAFAVVQSTTTIQAQMLNLFQVMKSLSSLVGINNTAIVEFNLNANHALPVPVGYTPVAFQAGDIHEIGQAMADMQHSSYYNIGESPGVDEDFYFRYRSNRFWVEVSLYWDIVANRFELSLNRIP